MLNTPILELVILLSFVYFIGSLILSAINEAIAGGLRLRQKQLKYALENMFFGSDWRPFVQRQLIKSPHIQSLMKKNGRYPAYIPAKSFVLTIVEQFRKSETTTLRYQKNKLSDSITALEIPYGLKQVLLDFAKQVEAIYPDNEKQIEEFEKKLADFYESTMDRAGGWYKRKTRTILLIIATALSIALNIDTIKIANDALSDKPKLSSAVDNISSNLDELAKLQSVAVTDTSVEVIAKKDGDIANEVNNIRLVYEQTTGYTFGYKSFFEEWKANFWRKLLGILITAFALQLGSNYWFDMMNKAVNIRAVGKRPDEKRPPQDVVTKEVK